MKKIIVLLVLCAVLLFPGQSSAWEAGFEPVTYNVTLTNADTEYSQELPAGTKSFTIQCRSAYVVRGAWVTGKVAGSTAPFFIVKSSGAYYETGISIEQGKTLYLASTQAGVIVEIIVWIGRP